MVNKIKISIRNLHKSFGKKKVLNGVDLDVETGKSLVVIYSKFINSGHGLN